MKVRVFSACSTSTTPLTKPSPGERGDRGEIVDDAISLENPDPRFRDYLLAVKTKVQSNWAFPCVKNPTTEDCEYRPARLVIDFGILANGRVQYVELRESSGMQIYDDSAVNAVRLSSPFPQIPDDVMRALKGSTGMPIRATFNYKVDYKARPRQR